MRGKCGETCSWKKNGYGYFFGVESKYEVYRVSSVSLRTTLLFEINFLLQNLTKSFSVILINRIIRDDIVNEI